MSFRDRISKYIVFFVIVITLGGVSNPNYIIAAEGEAEVVAREAIAPNPAESPSLARFFPDNTAIYLEINDISSAIEHFKQSALGKVWAEPDVQGFLKKPLAKFGEHLAPSLSSALYEISSHILSSLDELEPLLEKHVALGIILDPKKPISEAYGIMLVMEVSEKSSDQLSKSKIVSSYHGIDNIFVAEDGIVLLGLDNTPGKRLLKFNKDNAKDESILDNENFKNACRQLGKDADLLTYFNSDILHPALEKEAQAGDLDLQGIVPLLNLLGMADINCLGFSLTAEQPGYKTRAFVTSQVEQGKRTGLFSLIKNEPVSEELLDSVPQDIISFTASRIDLSGLAKALQAAGLEQQTINSMLTMKYIAGNGYDLNRNILSNLGDEVACITVDPDVVAGVPYFGINNMALVTRVKNPKLMKSNMDTLARFLSFYLKRSGKGEGGYLMKREEVVVRGVKIIHGGVFAPCFAIMDDFLIVASGPYTARLIIDTIAGKSPSIRSDEEFKETLARIDSTNASSISFARKMDAYRNSPALGIFTPAVVAGKIMPLFETENPKEKALNETCKNKLLITNLGLTFFCAQNLEYPYSLGEISEAFPDLLGNVQYHFCERNTYRYIGGPAATIAEDDMIINWCRNSHPPGGYNVLYKDGHLGFLFPDELADAHKRLCDMCNDIGLEDFNFTPPANDGINLRFDPYKQTVMEEVNPFAVIKDNPEAIEEILTTFELYRLPSKRSIEQHLFAAAGMRKSDDKTLTFESYTPFPMIHAGGANTLVLVLSCLGWEMLPQMQNTSQETDLAKSAENLKQIAAGIGEYFAKHKRMPAKMKQLWGNGKGVITDKNVFICPTRRKVNAASWRSDYILLPIAQYATKDNTIIVVEKALNFPDRGHCLYLDGSVELIQAASEDDYERFVNFLILDKNEQFIKKLAPRSCNGEEIEEEEPVDVF